MPGRFCRQRRQAQTASRIVEATVLALAAAIILASWPAFSGNMVSLEHRTADDIVFACVVAAAGIAVLAALLGRTGIGAGVLIAAITICATANSGPDPCRWLVSLFQRPASKRPSTIPSTSTARTSTDELWVNGVYLGKTPYTTTLGDFEAKAPYWPSPPADYEKEKSVSVHYAPNGPGPETRYRWIRFPRSICESKSPEAPRTPEYGAHPRLADFSRDDAAGKTPEHSQHPGREQTAHYFAKVRYAGEWGLAGNSCGGDGSRNNAGWQINARFEIIFRQRQKRLDTLLNIARLAGYRVGPEWFQAAETYNGDAWIALEKAAEEEPQMTAVRDAWAAWRCGLDKINNAGSAWTAFQQICDEAETEQQYLTDSVAGRAVELLVPKLPPKRLADKAAQLIRNTSTSGYCRWQSGGRLQFGWRQRPGTFYVGASSSFTSGTAPSGNRPQLPVGGFPVVHAVWMLDVQLRSTDQSQPNILQQQIAPEIVRWHYKDFNTLPMLLASYIGGPDVDKFLVRQPWGTPPDPWHQADWTYVSSQQVNKWLHLLAYLNDDAGRNFRRQRADLFMQLADRLYQSNMILWQASLDFLVMDPCLAKEYWPRFARLARQQSALWPLQNQWEYLARMGDAASVEMFVEAWKDTNIPLNDYWSALGVLDKLKPPTRRKVIDAIARQVRQDDGNLAGVLKSFGRKDHPEAKDRVISMLESHEPPAARLAEAEELFADLQKEPKTGRPSLRRNVRLWLEHAQPDSPLAAMLAKADKPELRLLAVDALREYPTPPNQALLERLRKDSDPAVRAAADEVTQQLKKLAAQKPAEYASGATAVASTSATIPASGKKDARER